MALINTINTGNRQVDQDNTWDFYVQFVSQWTDSSNVVKKLWAAKVMLSKRYSYVGLSRLDAEYFAKQILDKYKTSLTKYGVRWDSTTMQMTVYSSTAETQCAVVTPTHEAGAIWRVEVAVAAETEQIVVRDSSDSSPTIATLQALLSGVADYPEKAIYGTVRPTGSV